MAAMVPSGGGASKPWLKGRTAGSARPAAAITEACTAPLPRVFINVYSYFSASPGTVVGVMPATIARDGTVSLADVIFMAPVAAAADTTVREPPIGLPSEGARQRLLAWVDACRLRFEAEPRSLILDGANIAAHALSSPPFGAEGQASPSPGVQEEGGPRSAALFLALLHPLPADVFAGGSAAIETRRRPVVLGYHPVMLGHESPNPRYPERPNRIQRAMACLRRDTATMSCVTAIPADLGTTSSFRDIEASWDDIAPTHDATAGYAPLLRRESRSLPVVPTDVWLSDADDTTADAVLTAAGITVRAVLATFDEGALRKRRSAGPAAAVGALCLVRPPGHHCCGQKPNGFCVVNNVIVALDTLLHRRTVDGRAPRVAIVDLDVHHGDGTQAALQRLARRGAFPSSKASGAGAHMMLPAVSFMSMHRWDGGSFYPKTGGPTDLEDEDTSDRLFVLNVPFDTDRPRNVVISDWAMSRVVDELFAPLLRELEPDYILVSCGFDAAEGDPLGGMAVWGAYGYAVARLVTAVPTALGCCGVLEGGYDVDAVAMQSLAVLNALAFPDETRLASSWTMTSPTKWATAGAASHGTMENHQAWISQTIQRAAHARMARFANTATHGAMERIRRIIEPLSSGRGDVTAETT